MVKKHPSTFKMVLKQLKPMIPLIILSLLLAIIIVLATLLFPILIGRSIDLIIDIDNVDFIKLSHYFIIMVIDVLVLAMTNWLMAIINNHIVYKVNQKLRNQAIAKINNLPLSYLDNQEKGEIVSRIISDIDTFGDGLLLGFSQFFTGILTIILTLAIMIYYNIYIAILVFVLTPISFLVAKIISSKIYKKFKEQATIKGEQTGFIEEMINNQKIVQAFSYQKENEVKFEQINMKLKDVSLKANFYSSLTNPLTRFVNALVYAGVAILGTILIVTQQGVLTAGLLTTFLSYANQYGKPFNEISGVITEMQNSLACASRIFELLNQKELPNENHLLDVDLQGNVLLKNVYFSYDKNKSLIEDFNIKVTKGQKVAIVGPTGCGKTTLINLLMKFYEVDSGNIYYDDYNLKDIKTNSLRDNIGMVLQDTWLKSTSIKENLCFGNPNVTINEIKEALEKCNCQSFIKQLPNGIDTIINEDGGMLSTGQKQLLCIARVMLCKKTILILDEATSNIDTRLEKKVQEAFNELMKNKTSFIVAHRLSTIVNADVIIVMKDGHIVEIGNHENLLKKKGFYFELYHSQFES